VAVAPRKDPEYGKPLRGDTKIPFLQFFQHLLETSLGIRHGIPSCCCRKAREILVRAIAFGY
jgi:hypothetical protein